MRFVVLLILLLSVFSGFSVAGEVSAVSSIKAPQDVSGSDKPVVDSIIIDNRNIFNTDSSGYSHWIFKLANKLHYKTRAGVIRREMLFKVGEPYPPELAEETTRNLRSRLPIFDSWIEIDTLTNSHLRTRVVTIDEWTLSAGPNVTRDGNENRYEMDITERNLMGRAQYLSLKYVLQDSDDNYFSTSFQDNRFWGNPLRINLGYSGNPLNKNKRLAVGHPFYNLIQDVSYGFDLLKTKQRRDIYRDNEIVGQYQSEGDDFKFDFAVRTGSYRQKAQLKAGYKYLYKHTFDQQVAEEVENPDFVTGSFPVDSVYHRFTIGFQIYDLNFAKLKHIDGIGYTEDFVLGQTAGLALSRAITPGFNDHLYDRVSVVLSQGYNLRKNILYWSFTHDSWFRGESEIRRTSELAAYYYNYNLPFLTFALRGIYRSDWRTDGSEGLVLGGTTGIRGYNKFFKTGNRQAVMNMETRLFPGIKILSVILSPTIFIDGGRIWKADDAVQFKDFYFSGGVGFRIGAGHSSRNKLMRIDLAYSEYAGWEISIGTNQYFNAGKASFFLTTH